MAKKINIEVSARHIHVSQEDLEALFGKDYQLKKLRDLTVPPEFAAQETVEVINGDKKISKVRIIGPVRKETQIELSFTDAVKLGLNPPVRISGDLEGTPGITLVGPKGKLKLERGVIISWRHIHCGPKEAREIGVNDRQIVSVLVKGDRSLVFHNVVVRVRGGDVLCMHIDTDEGNAAGILRQGKGEILKE